MAMQPMYQQPPAAPKKGFPVWAIILIAIGGVFLLIFVVMIFLGIYGTRKYLISAKTAEAKNTIGAISRGAVNAYEREQGGNELLGDVPAGVTHRLCTSANPV